MHPIDHAIIALYLLAMIGVGLWYARRQAHPDEYFVGDRRMGSFHVGLSIVATDVGGGFSIGLGGLGFVMGLSASWLLFTGLLGAWLAIVLLIPRVKRLGDTHRWLTFADWLHHRYDGRARTVAAVVAGLGYAGFVGGQILAGAKLTSVAFGTSLELAVLVMAAVVIGYTALGGLQAVIATDTVQWGVLLVGLVLVALPLAWVEVGGLEGLRAAVPPEHLSLTNIDPFEALTWLVTIVPIWFVANTLWQRIYATRDEATARRAFAVAGLLEWPLMAFVGATLGMLARVKFPTVEAELGLPLLVRDVLPVGAVGVVLAAYFAAIMSTADSCLLASVGHLVCDLAPRITRRALSHRETLRASRILTIVVGAASVSVALLLPKVLDAILLAYAFMVSGLFVPVLGGLLWRRASPAGALASMLVGGTTAVALSITPLEVGGSIGRLLSQPVLVALPLAALALVLGSLARPSGAPAAEAPR